ncbi:MAG: hypothetical protein Q4G63_12410 [Bacteroidia bacterium]|nr:hypothetical protein [Bacteroidia bacterium]
MKKSNNYRTFTIRLSTDENSELEKLKNQFQLTTDNGAIRFLISNYGDLYKRYLSEQKRGNKAENKLTDLQTNLNDIRRVFKMVLKD